MVLRSNQELYEFLGGLAERLRAIGADAMQVRIEHARGCASGFSTEFLGEARIALNDLIGAHIDGLTAAEIERILDVTHQLDGALKERI